MSILFDVINGDLRRVRDYMDVSKPPFVIDGCTEFLLEVECVLGREETGSGVILGAVLSDKCKGVIFVIFRDESGWIDR